MISYHIRNMRISVKCLSLLLMLLLLKIYATVGDAKFCEEDDDILNSDLASPNCDENSNQYQAGINSSGCENKTDSGNCSSSPTVGVVSLESSINQKDSSSKDNFEVIEDVLMPKGNEAALNLNLAKNKQTKNFYTIDERWFRILIKRNCRVYPKSCSRLKSDEGS